MKKSKLFSIIFAIITIALAVLSLAFLEWNKNKPNFDNDNPFKTYNILFVLVAVFALVFLFKKSKFIGIAAIGAVLISILFNDGYNTNNILKLVVPYENQKAFNFLLLAGFIGAVIFDIIKNNKIAKIVAIVYFIFLVAYAFNFIPDLLTDFKQKQYTFAFLAEVSLFVTFILAFCDFGGEAEAAKEPVVVEENNEAQEEKAGEEVVEENNEVQAEAEEEKASSDEE